MTDANLMDAHCIHDKVWWECEICAEEIEAQLSKSL